METFLGSIVEIVLFMVLIARSSSAANGHSLIPVIKAAILGSILANLLLCLGICFFVGGMNREQQKFDGAISEVGNGLLLTAAFGLSIPCAFYVAVQGTPTISPEHLEDLVLQISRTTAVLLLLAFFTYVFQTSYR